MISVSLAIEAPKKHVQSHGSVHAFYSSCKSISCYALGGFGAPGAPGVEGAPGLVGAAAVGAAPSGGRGSLQNGHATGLKFGDTIFFPHEGQTSGPVVVSGGLKHIMFPFLSLLRINFEGTRLGLNRCLVRSLQAQSILRNGLIGNKQLSVDALKAFVDSAHLLKQCLLCYAF